MQTPHRGVATTVVAGVSPAQVQRHCSRHGCLYIRRRPYDRRRRHIAARCPYRSPITNHSGIRDWVSAAESDALSASEYSSAWVLAAE
jgi:hypothetical protein